MGAWALWLLLVCAELIRSFLPRQWGPELWGEWALQHLWDGALDQGQFFSSQYPRGPVACQREEIKLTSRGWQRQGAQEEPAGKNQSPSRKGHSAKRAGPQPPADLPKSLPTCVSAAGAQSLPCLLHRRDRRPELPDQRETVPRRTRILARGLGAFSPCPGWKPRPVRHSAEGLHTEGHQLTKHWRMEAFFLVQYLNFPFLGTTT